MFAGEDGRAERRSERYYERNNDPTFQQFARQPYHFVDEQGRQYMIAVRDGAPFNNTRFKPHRAQQRRGAGAATAAQTLRCQTNSEGHVVLFVKLPRQGVHRWFTAREIGQTLLLHRKDERRERQLVRLRQAMKPTEKRRTGTVVVSHLSEAYCNRLLNLQRRENQQPQRREPPRLRLV